MKPRVKCRNISIIRWGNTPYFISELYRMSSHPKLGPPRCESAQRTSPILRIDFERKMMETENTIYWWED